MSRKIARDTVYKLIFEYLFTGDVATVSMELAFLDQSLTDTDKSYILKAYRGVIDKKGELIELISNYSEGFSAERIFKPDLACLLLATYEMLYIDDIPLNVSISEAVELVKKYSTEKSSSYVNGILSSIYKYLNK